MPDKKGRASGETDDGTLDVVTDLKAQRDAFVNTFFRKGAEFTEELVRENERLRIQISSLERDNAKLRAQLASDAAMRDLLRKIEELETEKQILLSNVEQAHAASTHASSRSSEIENELENFANLYVASYQLHSSLRWPVVTRQLRELMQQLVGARQVAFFVPSADDKELVPLIAEGIGASDLPTVRLGEVDSTDAAAALIERVYLTGVPFVMSGSITEAGRKNPCACVPLKLEEDVVAVLIVFSLFPQKTEFVHVDHELFKLLGAHAAAALVGAELFTAGSNRIPVLAKEDANLVEVSRK